ncbi:putative phosphonate transport system ATP-binding protein [Arboricoccus pini]|uniref:Putative phosphonate transport system ATP-binding protein n=1 Tax=Arboricoccus pini TaxID=1963835 RepID=A0A212R1Z2_9PROT|nr:phosphonate C-P lyase system protein PhnK [Arboricoccus pini]SNB66022.1 putative phosphonate transport system ATP-binding protein [Arboricoccus pini]
MSAKPLLDVTGLTKFYGQRLGCEDVSFDLFEGDVLAVVGESGSGKSTLLGLLAGELEPTAGHIDYRQQNDETVELGSLDEGARRALMRTEWGFVRQDPREGLRMAVTAGGNVGERLMAKGDRHYGQIRQRAGDWLEKVEIEAQRIDETPRSFSGGMRQRLQIARNLVTHPRLVLMDEPTSGLDVSVQARLLDLIRGLVTDLGLAVVIVTHDLAVARILSHRIMVMRRGRVIEQGLTDQVLDDPADAYTQLLVASVLAA